MGMMYTGQFNAVAVTAQQDLFEITAPSNAVAIIHHIELSQNTEFGDAQEEELLILLRRGVSTTTGSGGSTVTLAKLETGYASPGITAKANNTTKMSSGTITTIMPGAWNVRAERLWLPTPEIRIVLSPSERLTVELATTPADSITMNGVFTAEQIGG
jgi:hypothetical protein